jgi:[amino group carrier protein]-lysine/ornithine hydrolase
VEFWNRLVEICARENRPAGRMFDRLSPVLQEMRSAGDGFSETAELGGNVRLPLRVTPDQMHRILREAADGIGTASTEGIPLTAYRVEKNTPVVGAFLASIRSLGGDPSFSLKLGTSDLCIVGPAWNCPMAVYGPGDSALDHTPGECISLEEYGKAVAVLGGVLKRMTATAR